MQRTKFLILTLIFVIAAGVIWTISYSRASEPYCWRYKVTVEINTPEGVKSGNAVREACLTPFEGYNPQVVDFKERVTGEAVIVDLGRFGKIFAILSPSDTIFDVEKSIGGPPLFSQEGAKFYSKLSKGTKALLSAEHYPTLVTFRNLNDPITIDVVMGNVFDKQKKEYVQVDKFSEFFGEGVHLRNISIEITDDPIQWKIESILPWVNDYYNKMLDGTRNNHSNAQHPIANRFGSGSFTLPKGQRHE